MINFNRGNDDAAFRAAFTDGKRMAAEITKLFPKEVKLEFEKVFMPYCLWGKKAYAGMLFTDPDKPGEYKRKGIASVRGDKIKFVTRLTDALVKQMMKDKSTVGAKQLLHEQLRKLVDNELPVEDFIIEKKLAKETEMYHNTSQARNALKSKEKKVPEHVQVAEDIARRTPGQAPKAGSIVAYVLAYDKEKKCRVPVDVAWFKANPQRYRIHIVHYLENLIHETIGKLIDLPRFTNDPYWLFQTYITRANARGMESDMTKFVRKRKWDDVRQEKADERKDENNNSNVEGKEERRDETGTGVPNATDAIDESRVYASKMKRQRLKKEAERKLKDDARAAGRDYKSFVQGGARIASFVRKRPASVLLEHYGEAGEDGERVELVQVGVPKPVLKKPKTQKK